MGSKSDFAAMLSFVGKHKIHPVIAGVFPLDKINEAFAFLKSTAQFGKVVLAIPSYEDWIAVRHTWISGP